ncbi:hypothetical protein D3C72_1462740 [compost metagenome]
MPDAGQGRGPNGGQDIKLRLRPRWRAKRRVVARHGDEPRQGQDLQRRQHNFATRESSGSVQVHQGEPHEYGDKQRTGVNIRQPGIQHGHEQRHFRAHDQHERNEVRRADHEPRGGAQIAFGKGAKSAGRRMSAGDTAQAGHQRYRYQRRGQIGQHRGGTSRQQREGATGDESVADDGAEGDHRHLPSAKNRGQPGFSAHDVTQCVHIDFALPKSVPARQTQAVANPQPKAATSFQARL